MADFVAVIRRAVDGLADNTPELRAKVYEKARGAIRRQLENMTPPPPPALVEKQLEKLEAAIREVEEENTEALLDSAAPDSGPGGFAFDDDQDVPPPPAPAAPVVPPSTQPRDKTPDRAPEVKAAPAFPPQTPSPERPAAAPTQAAKPDAEPSAGATKPPAATAGGPSFSPAVPGSAADRATPMARSSSVAPARDAEVAKPSRVVPATARREPGFEPDQDADARPAGILPDPDDDPVIGPAHDEVFGLKPEPRQASATRKAAGKPNEAKTSAGGQASRGTVQRILVAALVLLVLGGAGYGLWINRDAFLGTGTTDTAQSSAGGNDGGAAGTGAGTGAGQASAPDAAKPSSTAETAPAGDGGDGLQKFTQRLQADGSEIDPGPAPETGSGSPDEGRTVTAQTEAPKDAAPASGPAATAVAEAPGAATAPGSTAATAAQKPAGVLQKMFLYEERLGQQAPSAIEGTVVWSLANESPGADAVPEPAIHGEISVPDKGMTALITIKRNADESLPASHLIEIVFALPGNFEGGGIQSIQRVAMKQTEQDQGNPLIAVPAKITDDFFMVALNDYPDAVKTNTELLRTRNWIDIPITYGNSRRALLTLEKGSSGAEVFDKALRAWAAKTPAPAAAPAETGAPPSAGAAPADAATPGQ